MKIIRGQKIWINIKGNIKETTVKSIGRKYIITEYNSKMKFDREHLIEIDGYGSPNSLIVDIHKYEKIQYYNNLINELQHFKWEKLSEDKLERIKDIIK